jgi:hypothetical protein
VSPGVEQQQLSAGRARHQGEAGDPAQIQSLAAVRGRRTVLRPSTSRRECSAGCPGGPGRQRVAVRPRASVIRTCARVSRDPGGTAARIVSDELAASDVVVAGGSGCCLPAWTRTSTPPACSARRLEERHPISEVRVHPVGGHRPPAGDPVAGRSMAAQIRAVGRPSRVTRGGVCPGPLRPGTTKRTRFPPQACVSTLADPARRGADPGSRPAGGTTFRVRSHEGADGGGGVGGGRRSAGGRPSAGWSAAPGPAGGVAPVEPVVRRRGVRPVPGVHSLLK